MFEVTADEKIEEAEVKQAVQQGIQSFLGVYGCAKAGVMLVENDSQRGIVKVQPKYVDQVKTALALIKEISKKQVQVKTMRVSGMLQNVKTGGVK